MYRTPVFDVAVECLFTNTTPIGAYRGAGRPEGNYFIERLIDTAAAETGHDRVELRRRNHIRPADMPYKAPSGLTYDSGDFPAVLDRALTAADWDGFAARRAESEAGAAYAASASATTSRSPRRRPTRWAASASRPTAR